jgi:hypothetical protein
MITASIKSPIDCLVLAAMQRKPADSQILVEMNVSVFYPLIYGRDPTPARAAASFAVINSTSAIHPCTSPGPRGLVAERPAACVFRS